jgi:hypothetical protein
MNKTKKNIIMVGLLTMFLSILYPPHKAFLRYSSSGVIWDWIWNFRAVIRLDILICEILAIAILTGIFILADEKQKRIIFKVLKWVWIVFLIMVAYKATIIGFAHGNFSILFISLLFLSITWLIIILIKKRKKNKVRHERN